MNVQDMLASNYLSGQEIPTPQVVTIRSAELKELGQGDEKQTKVVLEFYELPKSLPLNKTRLKTMVDLYGLETAVWVGKPVMIFGQQLASGKFAGQWTISIVKAPAMPVQAVAATAITEEL